MTLISGKELNVLFVKKKASTGEKNGVSYLNGQIKFQGVSLNVYSYLTDGVLIDTGAQSLHTFLNHLWMKAISTRS